MPPGSTSLAQLRKSIRGLRRDLGTLQHVRRLDAVRDWIEDLAYSLCWYSKHRVWSVPTRRWEGPRGSSRWPLPRRFTR